MMSGTMTMTNAVVLIEAERDALSTLGGALADIEGVAEAYSVTGEWDFVAIVRVPDHEQLADVVTARSAACRACAERRRWSRSRPTRATISRRCSRSANDAARRWRRCRSRRSTARRSGSCWRRAGGAARGPCGGRDRGGGRAAGARDRRGADAREQQILTMAATSRSASATAACTASRRTRAAT